MAAAQAAEKHGYEWGLAWYSQWCIYIYYIYTYIHIYYIYTIYTYILCIGTIYIYIYIYIYIFTNSRRTFKDILPEHLLNDHEDCPKQHENIPCWNGASCLEFEGKSMKTETRTLSKFLNGREAITEQILVSEERHESKSAAMWESKPGIWAGKLNTWVRSFEIQKL